MLANPESAASRLCNRSLHVTQIYVQSIMRDLGPRIRCWGMVACTPCSSHTQKPRTDYKLQMGNFYGQN